MDGFYKCIEGCELKFITNVSTHTNDKFVVVKVIIKLVQNMAFKDLLLYIIETN